MSIESNSSSPVTHEEIAALAYEYWQQRGEEQGSAETDWLRAEQDLLDVRLPSDILESEHPE